MDLPIVHMMQIVLRCLRILVRF